MSPIDFIQSNEKSKNYSNSTPPPQKKILIEGGRRQRDEARQNEG